MDRNQYEPVYLISVAAKLCGVHPQTLRLYERLGLVTPQRVNAKNRLYSDADLLRLRQIQRLTQDMGVNLAGVEVMLELLDKISQMQQQMDVMVEQMDDAMRERIRQTLDPGPQRSLPSSIVEN